MKRKIMRIFAMGVLVSTALNISAQTTRPTAPTVSGFAPNPVSGYTPAPVTGYSTAPVPSLAPNPIGPLATNFTQFAPIGGTTTNSVITLPPPAPLTPVPNTTTTLPTTNASGFTPLF